MVRPAFQNLAIELWIHDGKLGLTRPSLCVFHDSLDTGYPLLAALHEIEDDGCPARRTLTFADCARKKAISKLILSFAAKSEDLKVMSIQRDHEVATIQFTSLGLPLLIEAVSAWLRGSEDFGVAPRHSSLKPKVLGKLDRESGELWFWGPGYNGP